MLVNFMDLTRYISMNAFYCPSLVNVLLCLNRGRNHTAEGDKLLQRAEVTPRPVDPMRPYFREKIHMAGLKRDK